jgi:hypothetical protein
MRQVAIELPSRRKTVPLINRKAAAPIRPAAGMHQRTCGARSIDMLDIALLALGLGFFALTIGYAIACDEL